MDRNTFHIPCTTEPMIMDVTTTFPGCFASLTRTICPPLTALQAPHIQTHLTLPASRIGYMKHLGKYGMAPSHWQIRRYYRAQVTLLQSTGNIPFILNKNETKKHSRGSNHVNKDVQGYGYARPDNSSISYMPLLLLYIFKGHCSSWLHIIC